MPFLLDSQPAFSRWCKATRQSSANYWEAYSLRGWSFKTNRKETFSCFRLWKGWWARTTRKKCSRDSRRRTWNHNHFPGALLATCTVVCRPSKTLPWFNLKSLFQVLNRPTSCCYPSQWRCWPVSDLCASPSFWACAATHRQFTECTPISWSLEWTG